MEKLKGAQAESHLNVQLSHLNLYISSISSCQQGVSVTPLMTPTQVFRQPQRMMGGMFKLFPICRVSISPAFRLSVCRTAQESSLLNDGLPFLLLVSRVFLYEAREAFLLFFFAFSTYKDGFNHSLIV